MNKRLEMTLEKNKDKLKDIFYIDCYNKTINSEICGTITTGVSFRNEIFIGEIIDSSQSEKTKGC